MQGSLPQAVVGTQPTSCGNTEVGGESILQPMKRWHIFITGHSYPAMTGSPIMDHNVPPCMQSIYTCKKKNTWPYQKERRMTLILPPYWIMMLPHLQVGLSLYIILKWASQELKDPKDYCLLSSWTPWTSTVKPTCIYLPAPISPKNKPLGSYKASSNENGIDWRMIDKWSGTEMQTCHFLLEAFAETRPLSPASWSVLPSPWSVTADTDDVLSAFQYVDHI